MKRKPSTMRMGPASLFALIIILCLAVLGVLSATSAQAGSAMAQRQASFATADYANETVAQTLYARADEALEPVRAQGGGSQAGCAALDAALPRISEEAAAAVEKPPALSVSLDGSQLTAHLETEDGRCLDVSLQVNDDASLSVASWKASTLWVEDTSDVLWTAESSQTV